MSQSESFTAKQVAEIYDVNEVSVLKAKVDVLNSVVSRLSRPGTSGSKELMAAANIYSFYVEPTIEQAQYVNNKNFDYRGNQTQISLLTNYHPRLRNHENFSYSNNRNV